MDFDEIPFDWLEPGVHLEVKPNYRTAGIFPWPVRPLIIGQKLAAGTIVPGQIVEITRPEEAVALFGLGSIGAEQVDAFRKANKTTSLHVMALADAAGATQATGTFTLTGAVSTAVVLRFLVNGRPIRFTALAGDNVAAMATKLAAAINGDAANLVTASAAAGVVTVTSRHGGEVGNEIDLRVDARAQPVPAGLGIAVAPMSGGSGNPTLVTALDAIGTGWFTDVTTPWTDATNLSVLSEWLRNRYVAMAKKDAHAYLAKRGTFGELATFGERTNSPYLSKAGLKRSPSPAWRIAASLMGLAAFHLTNDPARQLRSLVLPGIVAPDPIDQFDETEQDLLLRKGISTFDALPDGSLTVSRLVTTYKVSALGVPDRAWLDIMVPKTMSRIRYDWAAYISLLYPRAKLIDDEDDGAFVGRQAGDEDPGSAVVTPRRMKASWAGRCRLYAERVWIEQVDRTIRESAFARSDTNPNRLESRQQVRVVGNLMTLAGSLEFQV